MGENGVRHNPEKNRAVCVIAKSSVWGLRALLALTLVFLAGVFILGLVIKIRHDWIWTEVGKQLVGMLILVAFFGLLFLVLWLLLKWYEWAKNYLRDC